ncbi:MAG: hypothetical protein Ta2B_17650 [Termitinemataceae bacterium]|nr:MAG: hypothetical protein Ta2B_17650 [Termitinemataceae bacterium]
MNNNYHQVRLGDVGQIITGKTPPTDNPSNYNGEIQFLTPSDDLSVKHIYKTKKTISEKGLLVVKNCLLPPNSISVSCIGSDLGKVVITTKPTITNQQINSIIPSQEYDVDYIYYSLLQIGKLLNFISKTSTAVPIVNKSDFSKYTIAAPPLPIQRTIAATLSCLDDKIELNNRINANLEAGAGAIFKSWFVDFEPFQGGEFVDSELGKIPKGWRVGIISDFAKNIVCGKTPSTKNEDYYGDTIPFITIPDMHNNVYVINTERYLSKSGEKSQSNKTIPKNSICVSCIATTGLVSLTSENSQTNQQINTIICADSKSYIYAYLYIKGLTSQISALASSGSATPNLNKEQFSKIKMLIPSMNIIHQFFDIIEPMFLTIKKNQEQSRALASIRDILLPRLMSGEIEVPKEENQK